jgi:hypothetical protein
LTRRTRAQADAVNIDQHIIEREILRLVSERGAAKTLAPMDVARSLAGDHPDGWGPVMPAIRRAAVRLMKAGQIVIYRKGRPVDPDDFKGVYRIGLPETAYREERGPGSSSDV